MVPFRFAIPTLEHVIEASTYTPAKDKSIVAGANAGRVDHLVTLDKKHLLDKRDQIEPNVRFKIIRPENLLVVLRSRN